MADEGWAAKFKGKCVKIRLENVSKSLSFKEHFNARAEVLHLLEGISCELDDGENLAILGQSGSGKSTLAKLISFSEPKSGGKIYINNEEITDKNELKKDIRYILQNQKQALNPALKVKTAIAHVRSYLKLSFSQNELKELLANLNLKDEILNSAGFISKEKIYFSYGRNPRECYQQYIDLITVKEEGINVFILTPQVFGARNNSRTVSNPRVLHIINHFNDLGLNLLNVYEITIPFSEGNSVSLQRIPINKVNVQSAINFCRADPTFTSNLIFCRTCKYNNSCSIKDMIPIYRV